MLDLIKSLFRNEAKSKDIAKNRLKIVIMQQKSNISPQVLEELKKDIISVFKKYLEIDEGGMEINVGQENNTMGISVSIPVKEVKKRGCND
ncbi:MAG: cell division topological specificity factor MinE [Fusobacteria bacterium]|nr:cell division topological specificity factor MinE [Fusobacteriota bacterium]